MANSAEEIFNQYKDEYLEAYKKANGEETTIEYSNGWVYVGEHRQGDGFRSKMLPTYIRNLNKRAYSQENDLPEAPCGNVFIKPKFIKAETTILKNKFNLNIGKTPIGTYYLDDEDKFHVLSANILNTVVDSEREARLLLIKEAETFIKNLEYENS